MISGSHEELATLIARLNRGNIVFAGPVQAGDDGFGVKIIAGGEGRQVLQFEATLAAADLVSAKTLRDAFIAEVTKQLELRHVTLRECRSDRELFEWSAASYPNRDLEVSRVKLLGGGTA